MVENPERKNLRVNRLDVISGLSEKDLYQRFAQEKLDALIELGPSTFITVTDSAGNFLEDYYHNYELANTETKSSYVIYYNQQSENEHLISRFLSGLNNLNIAQNPALGSMIVNKRLQLEDSTLKSGNSQLVITHSSHPFRVFMLNKLATMATDKGMSLSMNASSAMWPDISLSHYPYPETEKLLQWEAPVYVLSHDNNARISFEHQPWNMTVNAVQKKGKN
jgi:hypothetical protein